MSHIEIILAFVIFVSFISFAFYFFGPANISRLIETSLDYTSREILKNVTTYLEIYTVNINTQKNVPDRITIDIKDIPSYKNVRIENYSQFVLPSYRSSDGLIHVDRKGSNFLIIEASEEFDAGEILNGVLHLEYYEISSKNKRKVISEKKVLKLNESYYKDYLLLKQKIFNLPGRVNFGFDFISSNSQIEAQRKIPADLDVFARKERAEILSKDGSLNFADLIIRVW